MNNENNTNYNVNIIEKKGTCDSTLFEKMCKNGDIEATRVKDIVGKNVEITGYAVCDITTKGETFTIVYYATSDRGIISSGSLVFKKSVETYFEECKIFNITKVKTKKGHTFKAVPVLFATNEDYTEEYEEIEE